MILVQGLAGLHIEKISSSMKGAFAAMHLGLTDALVSYCKEQRERHI